MSTAAKENAGRTPGGFPESVQETRGSVPHPIPDAQARKALAVRVREASQ
jgi:hypothetical protein